MRLVIRLLDAGLVDQQIDDQVDTSPLEPAVVSGRKTPTEPTSRVSASSNRALRLTCR